MKPYNHRNIEAKWQKKWAKSGIYRSKERPRTKKAYVLDMFPYPSGEGLHVGHPKGYIATDIYSRMKRMQGHSVLHPMGWDAFGLPAENYAIKNKVHPRRAVEKNIKRFKEQLGMIGLDYDWSREINTTDPGYYKWTQWIFLQLLKNGLAYQSWEPINWCPSCQTGLANEDLEDGKCERCGSVVEKKPMRQWMLKITDYAERLLTDLDLLPKWQEHIKESQRNWIGKSEGAEIDFPLDLGKKYTYVLLHGFQSGSDRPRYKFWKSELERMGHTVIIPALPNTNTPSEAEQVRAALAATSYDNKTVLFGSSLGTVVAMKVLEKLERPIARLVLAGGFIDTHFKDRKKRNFEKRFEWRFDVERIKRNTSSITLLRDVHDNVISEGQTSRLEKMLSVKAECVEGEKPHFGGEKERTVLMWLRPTVRVFTTRADTLFGATYLVLAPEHPWVVLALKHGTVLKNNESVRAYIESAKKKTEIERTAEGKEKTGVRLEGVEAVNPATGEKIPLFVADYVLAHYGTGAIMAVPAHDERDFQFAQKFNLPIREVVEPLMARVSGGDAIKSGEPYEERNSVLAFVEHWADKKYIGVHYKPTNINECVSGGIEINETPEEAGHREIREETGYKNAQFIRALPGKIHAKYFSVEAKKNRFAHFTPLLFKLNDGSRVPVSDHEGSRHDIRWYTEEEFKKFINRDEIRFAWDRLKSPRMYAGEGILGNSGEFSGMTSEEARHRIAEVFGIKKITYKLRDWVFSRQRYWGEPIPVIHCDRCGVVPVPEKDLPVRLPDVRKYAPTGTGESPLAAIEKWVNVKCPKCKGKAKRETNTMPQWAGSSWYYLRYMDPNNRRALVDKKREKYWTPVDLYVGGAEHATRHLIYARFWHKFLKDIQIVSNDEPFTRLISVGLIQAEDGRKMSKRFGNVINPDEIVKTYGADTLRLYEMFMGPFTDAIAWNTQAMIGTRRFVERVWKLQANVEKEDNPILQASLHKTIKKVGDDIMQFKFNTAISQMMIFVNDASGQRLGKSQWELFLKTLAPFAPHIAEELWQTLGHSRSIHLEPWPRHQANFLEKETVVIAVQVNGKTRATIEIMRDADTETVQNEARRAAAKWITAEVRKVIYVPGRIVNIVC